jgi:hypothetical protein
MLAKLLLAAVPVVTIGISSLTVSESPPAVPLDRLTLAAVSEPQTAQFVPPYTGYAYRYTGYRPPSYRYSGYSYVSFPYRDPGFGYRPPSYSYSGYRYTGYRYTGYSYSPYRYSGYRPGYRYRVNYGGGDE